MRGTDALHVRKSHDRILWLFFFVFTGSLSLNVCLGLELLGVHRQIALLSFPHRIEAAVGGSSFDLDVSRSDGKDAKINLVSPSRPIVLYIFNPTCIWCRLNLAAIRDLAGREKQKFEFIGISTTGRGLDQYLAKSPLPFPVYVVSTTADLGKLDFVGTPQTIVISMQGRIEHNWPGAYAGASRNSIESYFHTSLPLSTSISGISTR
jgi:hypothetical protein